MNISSPGGPEEVAAFNDRCFLRLTTGSPVSQHQGYMSLADAQEMMRIRAIVYRFPQADPTGEARCTSHEDDGRIHPLICYYPNKVPGARR